MKITPDPTIRGSIQGQSSYELDWMIRTFINNGVKSYLEIGSRFGKVFDTIVRRCGITKAVSVDMPGGPWGREGSQRELKRIVNDLNAHLFLGNSRSEEIIEKVTQLGPFDAIFIDGDHRYDGVKADWENYGHLGKIVGFHDIDGDRKKVDGMKIECGKFWKEIKDDYYHEECIEPDRKMGIGLLWVSGTSS